MRVDRYQTYVMPDYGKMDPHIIKLTGITDDKLEGAPRFKEAMCDFEKWIGGGASLHFIHGVSQT